MVGDLTKARCHVVYNTGTHRLTPKKKVSSHEMPYGNLLDNLAATALFKSTLVLPGMPLGDFVSREFAGFDDLVSWIAQQASEKREDGQPSIFFRPLRRMDAIISWNEGNSGRAFWLLVDRGHDVRVLSEVRAVRLLFESNDNRTAWVRLTDAWVPAINIDKRKHTES